MPSSVFTFKLAPDWKLISAISQLDRFDASWTAIEKREGKSLKQLKSIATVRSVGASTRIEGSSLTDDEVEVVIGNKNIAKLEDRDSQEVAGYYDALDLITTTYHDIEINTGNIKTLHKVLLQHSTKDEWQRGDYKKHSNVAEATRVDGTKYEIFKTTAPGLQTGEAMEKLIAWYQSDQETHPIIKCALFSYDFVSIHPFQDGNGRLSRLLATLTLLKNNYTWIQYVSLEHEIENRKTEYYKELMQAQRQRPGEDVYSWVLFFLSSLNNICRQLMNKLETKGEISTLSPKEKSIYSYIENHPGSRSGEIAGKLTIPLPTVKRILSELTGKGLIVKHGSGAGTNYSL